MNPIRLPRAKSFLLASASAAALMIAQAAHARPLSESVLVGGSTGNAINPTSPIPGLPSVVSTQAQAQAQQARTTANLADAAARIQAALTAQTNARAAAQAAPSSVPNGLAAGGLNPDSGLSANGTANPVLTWVGADTPTQTAANGQTTVTVNQTQQAAILNWQTFNVGKQTTVNFVQKDSTGADQTSWVALNKVNDPNAKPSQIAGQITAPGSVYIVNRNGVIFTGTSQINVHSLIAAATDFDNTQFLNNGIYSTQTASNYNPVFTNAGGNVSVAAGANIQTAAPSSVTAGGGFVMLLGQNVENDGAITTPVGQTLLAAGDNFLIRPGYSTDGNPISTTNGSEVAVTIGADSSSGTATNKGYIYSPEGDITLVGRTVVQDGVAVSTSSVATRGTIHLINSLSDTEGSVTLGEGALTDVMPELDSSATALDAQRAGLAAASFTGAGGNSSDQFDDINYNASDLRYASRIDVVTGGSAEFASNSLSLANGGLINVDAQQRVQVDKGAMLDVSGVNVALPASANVLAVNIQGNEERDDPNNRDDGSLFNNDVYVDERNLLYVPAGTGGYSTDRYYTAGGLLEVSGELANVGHTIGEWTASGGSISLVTASAGAIVAQQGSDFNISGGSIAYQGGPVKTSWLLGSDGGVYNVNTAPADQTYVGLANSFNVDHTRWVVTDNYSSSIFAPSAIYEPGYVVGRDAGQLILGSSTVLFNGQIDAGVVAGTQQTGARPTSITDPFLEAQTTIPLAGILSIAPQISTGNTLLTPAVIAAVTFGAGETAGDHLSVNDSIPAGAVQTISLSADAINGFQLGGIIVQTGQIGDLGNTGYGSIEVDEPLTVVPGGQINLTGFVVDIYANLTAHSGAITVFADEEAQADSKAALIVGNGIHLDTTGLWTNASLNPGAQGSLAFINGGPISLTSGQDLILQKDSLLDASSGAGILMNGTEIGGSGGDISLIANAAIEQLQNYVLSPDGLVLDGSLRSYGVTKGGALTIQANAVVVGDNALVNGTLLPAGETAPTNLVLTSDVTFPAGSVRAIPTVITSALTFDAGAVLPFAVNLAAPATFAAGSTLPIDATITTHQYAAGQPLPVDLYTPGNNDSAHLVLAADWTIPSNASGTFYVYSGPDGNNYAAYPGGVLHAGDVLWGGYGQLPAGYVIPANVFPTGYGASTQTTLQAGTVLTSSVTLPAGTGWKAGLPLPVTGGLPAGSTLPAGVALTEPVTAQAGLLIYAGEIAPQDASVNAPLQLTPAFFDQGFSSYSVNGVNGVSIMPNTSISPEMPLMRFTGQSIAAPTGSDAESVLQLWQPPLYQPDPITAKLNQRPGASLMFTAKLPDLLNVATVPDFDAAAHSLSLGNGASIAVDPGQTVTLAAWGEVDIEGSITAPGGSISILNTQPLPSGYLKITPLPPNTDSPNLALSIWLGASATLDVSGTSEISLDQFGRPFGTVQDGGSITVGSAGGPRSSEGVMPSTNAAVVIRPGATLLADGANGTIDLAAGLARTAPSHPINIYGDGGAINISSYEGLYLDGTMSAKAGGIRAAGGTLSLILETPHLGGEQFPVDDERQLRILTVDATTSPTLLTGDAVPGIADPGMMIGSAHISQEQIADGGFGNLVLFGGDAIAFSGDVSLSLQQSINIADGRISLDPNTPNANVHLSAPYVLFSGDVGEPQTPNSYANYINYDQSQATQNGTFSVDANLIDIENPVGFGLGATITLSSGSRVDDLPGFADVSLTSQGDIRFLPATQTVAQYPFDYYTSITTTNDLNLTAERIYPVTGATAYIIAGAVPAADYGTPLNPDATITLARIGTGDVAAPDSVFGHLLLWAPTINQGGALMAPLGGLTIGANGNLMTPWALDYNQMFQGDTSTVNFLLGSITSVSAAGLTIPYGGTADGISYYYNGSAVTYVDPLNDIGVNFGRSSNGSNVGSTIGNTFVQNEAFGINEGILVGSQTVNIAEGATVDLSGGGNVLGAGFVSGRGGSIDVLRAPLADANPANGFSAGANQIYAIVPNFTGAYAPIAPDVGAGSAAIGEQVTIGTGVSGLPAGTYTLLPSTYATLPGAYRVEVGGDAGEFQAGALAQGVSATSGTISTANTDIKSNRQVQLLLSDGTATRTFSQYNETSYSDFGRAQAATFGTPDPLLPIDVKTLMFQYGNVAGTGSALTNNGTFDMTPASDDSGEGHTGVVEIYEAPYPTNGAAPMEVRGEGDLPTAGTISFGDKDLSGFGAGTLILGGYESEGLAAGVSIEPSVYTPNGTVTITSSTGGITVNSGAVLDNAGQIFLSGSTDAPVVVRDGATVSTLGGGAAGWDSQTDNLLLQFGGIGLSNGSIIASVSGSSGSVASGATLLAENTILLAGGSGFTIGAAPVIAAKNLMIGGSAVNIGTADSLNAAAQNGTLPDGWSFNQAVLNAMLNPTVAANAPALETLTLIGADSINLIGNVDLSSLDPQTGKARISLVLDTPALYGLGGPSDVATITTDSLTWNGVSNGTTYTPPGAVQAGGPGTGQGQLVINSNTVTLGFPALTTPIQSEVDRVALGFSTVTVNAANEITANNNSTLAVYQSESISADAPPAYSGGNLILNTPMLTTAPGAILGLKAGGAIQLIAPSPGASATASSVALGGEIDLAASTIDIDTAVALPSGKFAAAAAGDINLGSNAHLDLSGRTTQIFDATGYSWGGSASLESTAGNISQDTASIIDVSANNNNAGSVSVTAMDEGAGAVSLAGQIIGAATGGYASGGVEIQATALNDFAGLNQRLDGGGIFGSRSFEIGTGDLVLSNLKANTIEVSLDNGSLIVNGTLDASGDAPGTIRLAAKNDLTLASSAVLDAHGNVLQVDSYGAPIDAENRGHVELTATNGTLTLMPNATIDVSSPEATPQGDIELNVGRTTETGGDARISATGPLSIKGAQTIAVNAFWTYVPLDPNGSIIQDNQDPGGNPVAPLANATDAGFVGLNQIDARDRQWVNTAIGNSDLLNRLSGLIAYTDDFHLRPGVEIDSATPLGDLNTVGDLDFSGFRYGSLNPNSQQTGIYGSGEPGFVVIRAGGNLNINGSISDGFMPGLNGPVPATGYFQTTEVDLLTPLIESGIPLSTDMTFNNLPTPDASRNQRVSGTFFYFGYYADQPTVVSGEVDEFLGVFKAGQKLPYFDVNSVFKAGTVLSFPGASNGTPILANATPVSRNSVAVDPSTPDGTTTSSVTNPNGTETVTTVTIGDQTVQLGVPMPALAPLLAPGSQSWSMRLVSGANLKAADTRAVQPKTVLDPTAIPARVTPENITAGIALPAAITFSNLPTPNTALGQRATDQYFYFAYYDRPTVVAGEVDDGNGQIHSVGSQISYFKVGTVFQAGTILSFPNENNGTLVVAATSTIPAIPPKGNITLNNPFTADNGPGFSVLRTGTGSLDLIAGESFTQGSLYGVYTAGTQVANVDPAFEPGRELLLDGTVVGQNNLMENAAISQQQPNYTTGGGDLLLKAQGNVTGYTVGSTSNGNGVSISNDIGNWLWREGGASINQPAAWWVNFGTWVAARDTNGNLLSVPNMGSQTAIMMTGFEGIGTLGGGNLTVSAGGNAGVLENAPATAASTDTALNLFVGGSGRVAPDGTMTQTGGGRLVFDVGGAINPAQDVEYGATGGQLYGVIGDLRGSVTINAGTIGSIGTSYTVKDGDDPRQQNPFIATTDNPMGGFVLAPGDATTIIQTRGDLVLSNVADPGLAPLQSGTSTQSGEAYSWFTLWQPNTAVSLDSAGGNLVPENVSADYPNNDGLPTILDNYNFIYPSVFQAVAQSGSIFYGGSVPTASENRQGNSIIELAPSPDSQLSMIAADSIYGDASGLLPMLWAVSGASPSVMATPQNPAYMVLTPARINTDSGLAIPIASNVYSGAATSGSIGGLFAYGEDTATTDIRDPKAPATQFYAGSGDILGLRYGYVAAAGDGMTNYVGDAPLTVRAGQDIIDFGAPYVLPVGSGNLGGQQRTSSDNPPSGAQAGSFIMQNDPSDVSLISAGRDILYANLIIAGPGDVEVLAGRNIYQGDRGLIESVGPVYGTATSDRSVGASVTLLAGIGSDSPDLSDFATLYLTSANMADPSVPLDFPQNQGKVVETYQDGLFSWLQKRFGYTGSENGALSYFLALPQQQQLLFDLQVYFSELDASDVEFNDPASRRFQSYVRGKQAISALFPDSSNDGTPAGGGGSITLASALDNVYGSFYGPQTGALWDSGIHTEFGGNINILTPSGGTTIGAESVVPGPDTGLLTEGQGNINIYSLGSIPLGLSRVFTTFGGDITMWSATGDINAGRGAKGTVVFAPVRRTYDLFGNVALAPTVPSQGAGIATLAPISGVAPGNVYLVAPEGIIDAGEAGIRVSGNAYLAALQVVNAANIQVKGQAFGLPPKPVTNLSFTAASNASTEAANIVRQMATQRQTVISVEVTGFGGGDTDQPSECIPTATNRCN